MRELTGLFRLARSFLGSLFLACRGEEPGGEPFVEGNQVLDPLAVALEGCTIGSTGTLPVEIGMRYRLRTLLIALAILPPILAPLGVWGWREYVAWRNARSTAPVAEPGYMGMVADDTPNIGQGVLVLEVRAGSPAEAGGLTVEDVIIAINNRRCRNLDDLDAALGQTPIGSKLMMKVTRGDKTQSLVVTLGKWRPPTNGPLTAP